MRIVVCVGLIVTLLTSACGGCTDPEPEGASCGPGERENPINGVCEPTRPAPDNNTVSDAGPSDAGEVEDTWHNPFLDATADVPEDEYCDPGLDSDRDGLSNECECDLGTDPSRADTDSDGASDGEEDADGNCNWDVGRETNPHQPDTDNDGLSDGDERELGTDPLDHDTDDDGIDDGAEANGCMDPLSQDSDGDGLPDDLEDTNLDGQLGTCPDHQYDPGCAGIESNPCDADSDGDGTPDGEEAAFLGCTPEDTANLVDPQLVESVAGNYQLALETTVDVAAVSGADAHAFNDAASGYAGAIAAVDKPAGATTPEALAAHVFSAIEGAFPGATQRATGRRTQTHDGFPATVGALVELSGGLAPDEVRDDALTYILSHPISHGASGNFSATAAGDPVLVAFQVVQRTGNRFIVSVVAVPESRYEADAENTGYRVDDLTGGTAIATAGEPLEDECVSYRVERRPKVDFIWILDASGSMSEEMAQVRSFASDFAAILGASNLDWRIAVTNASCIDIANDPAVSADVKTLYEPAGFTGPCPGLPGFGPPPIRNGALCNNAFTTDPAIFEACIDSVRSGIAQTEHTVTIGAAAIDRALPRSDADPSKIRTDAAVVLVSVTDEFDDLFQTKMGWTDGGNSGATPVDPTLDPGFDQAAVDNVVKPFADYFLRLDVGATVFGIYWIPGTSCPTGAEAAAGIHTMVAQTGGTAGSVCQSDLTATLQEIATASAGIASGLRLRGIPVAPSIVTKLGELASGNIVTLPRSRADGWDYDSTVNRVTFQGPNPPQTGDRVVIAYRRWAGSIRQCTTDVDCPREQKYRCVEGQCL